MPPKKDETKVNPEATINGFEPKETKLLAAGFVSMIGADKVSCVSQLGVLRCVVESKTVRETSTNNTR